MKSVFSRFLHPVVGPAGRGCVPHLPAPGCPPERPMDLERPCFPILDLLTGSRTAPPGRRQPTASPRDTGRRRR